MFDFIILVSICMLLVFWTKMPTLHYIVTMTLIFIYGIINHIKGLNEK